METLAIYSIAFLVGLSLNSGPVKDVPKNANSGIVWPEGFDPAKSKFYVENEIDIQASPETVWSILIDAEAWPVWYEGAKNVKASGGADRYLSPNSTISWETMGLKFDSKVKEFEPSRKLAWLSEKKSIQGYHVWIIQATDNGCKVITAESQNGWLTFMEKTFQPKKLFRLHEIWLVELKKKAESASKLSEGL